MRYMNDFSGEANDTDMITVGRISYVNVAPVYYGFDNGLTCPGLSFIRKTPAELNRLMVEGRLDISPVSTAAYAKNSDQWLILPDLAIACDGPVMSVRLFSRYPLDLLEGRKIVLTADSESAASLLRLILAEKRISSRFETLAVRTPADVPADAAAVLVIGNSALSYTWDIAFAHAWDLGDVWREMTGLPFVFALWAVRREFAERHPERVLAILALFYMSYEMGMEQIDDIAEDASRTLKLAESICSSYFKCLEYGLTERHKDGLRSYFDRLVSHRLISGRPRMRFFEPHRYFALDPQADEVEEVPSDMFQVN